MNVCVIPARGGQSAYTQKKYKRVLRQADDLLSRFSTTAIKSGLFGNVVSTDDEEIAETAQGFGAEIGE